MVAYTRRYPGMDTSGPRFLDGVEVIPLRTVARSGFDTLLHSAKVTYDIIRHDRADIVHIQNGGNSVFGAVLRLFGKKTFISQDGIDWKRKKWPWYARVFLRLSSFLTAFAHSAVIFDNIYAREEFEKRFHKSYDFIPFGADVVYDPDAERVLERLGLERGEYFLFVGRFIPDKGLHWLIPAFEALETRKTLVLVGGPRQSVRLQRRDQEHHRSAYRLPRLSLRARGSCPDAQTPTPMCSRRRSKVCRR